VATKRAHRGYTRKGRKLPSVTELLKGLGWGSDRLMFWANKIGRQGLYLSSSEATLNRRIGTLAHEYALDGFLTTGEVPAPPAGEVGDSVARAAYEHLTSFVRLWTCGLGDRCEVLAIECKMTGEIGGVWYGGTADLIVLLDGVPTVLDLKTGGGVYPSTAIQLEAYSYLWWFDGHRQAHDHLGRQLSPAARERRIASRLIGRTGIIHTEPGEPATLIMVDDDTRAACNQLWLGLVTAELWRPRFENFGSMLEQHNDAAKERRKTREELQARSKHDAPF
jgi:hypothetical protein